MQIGQLAARTGVSTHAIRYYERVGLLSPPERAQNRYREYTEAAIDELGFIKKAQHLGLTLADVRTVLEISAGGDPPCEHVRSAVVKHLADIDLNLGELRALRRTLRETLAKLDTTPRARTGCRCAVIEDT